MQKLLAGKTFLYASLYPFYNIFDMNFNPNLKLLSGLHKMKNLFKRKIFIKK